MTIAITDVIDGLKAEQRQHTARASAIGVIVTQLSDLYNAKRKAKTVKRSKKKMRHVTRRASAAVQAAVAEDDTLMAQLLKTIDQSSVGCQLGDLKRATPKSHGAERSTALQKLKARGDIERVGNVWLRVRG